MHRGNLTQVSSERNTDRRKARWRTIGKDRTDADEIRLNADYLMLSERWVIWPLKNCEYTEFGSRWRVVESWKYWKPGGDPWRKCMAMELSILLCIVGPGLVHLQERFLDLGMRDYPKDPISSEMIWHTGALTSWKSRRIVDNDTTNEISLPSLFGETTQSVSWTHVSLLSFFLPGYLPIYAIRLLWVIRGVVSKLHVFGAAMLLFLDLCCFAVLIPIGAALLHQGTTCRSECDIELSIGIILLLVGFVCRSLFVGCCLSMLNSVWCKSASTTFKQMEEQWKQFVSLKNRRLLW